MRSALVGLGGGGGGFDGGGGECGVRGGRDLEVRPWWK